MNVLQNFGQENFSVHLDSRHGHWYSGYTIKHIFVGKRKWKCKLRIVEAFKTKYILIIRLALVMNIN